MGAVPPFTAVAVNVTGIPAQIMLGDETMVIDGATVGVTVMVISLLVTVAGTAQVAFDVSTQLTIALLLKDAEVNVLLLPPAFAPLTIH